MDTWSYSVCYIHTNCGGRSEDVFQYFDIYNPGHLIQVVTMCPLIKSTAN